VKRNAGKIGAVVATGATLATSTPAKATTYPWDGLFTDASAAITALGTSATTLYGLVFTALVLVAVGFALVRKIAHKG